MPTRSEWLDRHVEAALLPELPIVDPHHHLWSRGGAPYLLDAFLEDAAAGHRVDATVYLECHAHYHRDGPEHLRPVGEVAFAAATGEACAARGGPRVCAGIVGHADLRLGDRLREVTDAMREAGRGRFRGLRQIAAWHPDPAVKGTVASPPPRLLEDARFRRGLAVLAAEGLGFETWVLHTQLAELLDAAQAAPGLGIVMNHSGGAIGMGPYAGRREQAFVEWRRGIAALARADNVFAKIGGFGMRLWGFGFHDRPTPPSSEEVARAIAPYVETLIETFGPGRCMFESNFPVDKGSYSYVVIWNAFKRLIASYAPAEQHALLRGTAERFYRLADGDRPAGRRATPGAAAAPRGS
ncbi:hypothetical protein OPKNFCMD_1317 [Methylobacterium crusticola]|uniref:Amidohydrolase-related domain-containing protein n=1 Tax=Methylobacterium crusticola TaxID=1697972 RepID=A0ABQ4QUH1_9HYPH|nr:amidohydrolase family protein [Methylobacterium crusticola]GJD48594.1 hypothetical protein OPKNFCMD_1317 [Methylobacterium crusticola]